MGVYNDIVVISKEKIDRKVGYIHRKRPFVTRENTDIADYKLDEYFISDITCKNSTHEDICSALNEIGCKEYTFVYTDDETYVIQYVDSNGKLLAQLDENRKWVFQNGWSCDDQFIDDILNKIVNVEKWEFRLPGLIEGVVIINN